MAFLRYTTPSGLSILNIYARSYGKRKFWHSRSSLTSFTYAELRLGNWNETYAECHLFPPNFYNKSLITPVELTHKHWYTKWSSANNWNSTWYDFSIHAPNKFQSTKPSSSSWTLPIPALDPYSISIQDRTNYLNSQQKCSSLCRASPRRGEAGETWPGPLPRQKGERMKRKWGTVRDILSSADEDNRRDVKSTRTKDRRERMATVKGRWQLYLTKPRSGSSFYALLVERQPRGEHNRSELAGLVLSRSLFVAALYTRPAYSLDGHIIRRLRALLQAAVFLTSPCEKERFWFMTVCAHLSPFRPSSTSTPVPVPPLGFYGSTVALSAATIAISHARMKRGVERFLATRSLRRGENFFYSRSTWNSDG